MSANRAKEAEGQAQVESEVNAPLVFQCKNCNSIVGDTLSFVLADEEAKTVTLSAMTKVECVDRALETSKSGRDVGCTFVPVKCVSCGKILGKVYKTTARAFDNIRDFYTISTDMISSYGLGSADCKTASDVAPPSLDVLSPAVTQIVQQHQSSITKMQQMILLLSEKVSELEKSSQQQQSSGQKRVAPSVVSSKDNSSPTTLPSSSSNTNLTKKPKP